MGRKGSTGEGQGHNSEIRRRDMGVFFSSVRLIPRMHFTRRHEISNDLMRSFKIEQEAFIAISQ